MASKSNELLQYAYGYIRLKDLLDEFDNDIRAIKSIVNRDENRYRLNLHIRLTLNHPNIGMHRRRFYNLARTAVISKLVDQPTSVLLADMYPRLSQLMVPQTPAILKEDSERAVCTAVEYPNMFFSNIHNTHISTALKAIQRLHASFMNKKYETRMRILTTLLSSFKQSREQMDDLFSIIVSSGRYDSVSQTIMPPSARQIEALLISANPSQVLHHMLMAWSVRLITDTRAVEILGTNPVIRPYRESKKSSNSNDPINSISDVGTDSLDAGLRELVSNYKIMVAELQEVEQNRIDRIVSQNKSAPTTPVVNTPESEREL